MNLNTVRVFVRDIAPAKRFYEQSLGLALRVDGSRYGYCVFDAGNTTLVVEVVGDDAPEDEQVLVGRFTGLSFAVRDVNAKYAELLSRGVAFSGAPELQTWGGSVATLRDPAGNELQIAQHPVT